MRRRVLRLRLWFCKIEPVIARKKATQITGAIVNLLGSYLKSWLLTCHAYPLWLFNYLQSRWGKVRSIGGNCSRWRKRASCLITLASVSIARSVWQISQVVSMKLLHVTRRNLRQVHLIWTNLCKPNKNQNMGSLPKTRFFSKKLFFSLGLQFFWSLELLVVIYLAIIYRLWLYMVIIILSSIYAWCFNDLKNMHYMFAMFPHLFDHVNLTQRLRTVVLRRPGGARLWLSWYRSGPPDGAAMTGGSHGVSSNTRGFMGDLLDLWYFSKKHQSIQL